MEELCKVLSQPRHQPLAVIAKTIKGKGIPGTTLRHAHTHTHTHTHSDPQCVRQICPDVWSLSEVLTCCVSFWFKGVSFSFGENTKPFHIVSLCLYLADPATFLAPNCFLGTLLSSETSLFFEL